MKTVDLYHLVALIALFLMVLCITLGYNDGVVLVIGIGILVVLLLGVHLVLDKQSKRMCVIEKKLEEVHYDAHFVKMRSELGVNLSVKEQAFFIESLANINILLNEIKTGNKPLSLVEIKSMLKDIKQKVDEISVKSPE